MTSEKTADKPILTTLRELNVGEMHTFPAEKQSYIKSACAAFGFEWNKKFQTKTNRGDRTITVIRTN